jgi:CheY-like chemotaxis protein
MASAPHLGSATRSDIDNRKKYLPGGSAVGEKALRILLVGNDAEEVALVRTMLSDLMGNGSNRLGHAGSVKGALKRLTESKYDLLPVDEQVQGRSGLELLRKLQSQGRVLPLVFLTGRAGDETGMEAMRAGASDYLYKPAINELNLARTIRCALCLRRRENQCRQAEDQLRVLSRAVEQAADLILITDREGNIEYVNPAFKGTGLRLATVYGIVKQSGGFFRVYSEPALGTTFKIYLPRIGAPARELEPAKHATEPLGGSETLLLVEDEAAVRRPASEFLKSCGYTVLEAPDGKDAILVAHAHKGTIHLMVTDVFMLYLSGSQLAEQLSKERPETKVSLLP